MTAWQVAGGFLDGLVGVVLRAVRVAAGAAVETVEGEAVAVIIEEVGTSVFVRAAVAVVQHDGMHDDSQPTQPPMPSRKTSRQPESTHGHACLFGCAGAGGVGRLRRVAVRRLGVWRRTAVGRKVVVGPSYERPRGLASWRIWGYAGRVVEVAAAEERTHSRSGGVMGSAILVGAAGGSLPVVEAAGPVPVVMSVGGLLGMRQVDALASRAPDRGFRVLVFVGEEYGRGGFRRASIACCGHASTHRPHPMQ